MDSEVFRNISKIIERDSKTSTYKFALLRGVIEVIQDNSPYIDVRENEVEIPTGLLIEKWLLYYYPILDSEIARYQINGTINLAFENHFYEVINYYKKNGNLSAFYNELKFKGISKVIQSDFFNLAKKLRDTITKMPMKYIGRSISNDYFSIFKYKNKPLRRDKKLDAEILINDFGKFTIPRDYYEAFKILGSFITGQDSLLFKWAEFSVRASGETISIEKVLNQVLKSPVTKRDVDSSKKLYAEILKKEGKIFCVWSGKLIASLSEANIDHVIPFSIWKNNDLWNLLPSSPKINSLKLDKIPSPELIEKRKNQIIHYWSIISEFQAIRFRKELKVALLGTLPFDNWKNSSISQLQNRCINLIDNRGCESWKI